MKRIGELFSSFTSSTSFDPPPSDRSSLRQDLEALQRMVRRIQAVLADAERWEIHDESVKLWLRELSCLACDADDLLDDYNYQLLRAQVEASVQSDGASRLPLGRKHHQEVSNLTTASPSSDDSTWNKLADGMRKIRLRFEDISRQRDALQLKEGAVRQRQNVAVRPPTSHLPDTPTIFGREKIMEDVIRMLLSPDGGENHSLSVLPIVGMGGVGKTTLVQHVYNNHRVCGRFQLKGWVCVSDDFAVDSLTRRIIESLTGLPCQLIEFDAMQRKLIEVLKKGKRFLVVLDDVWNETPSFWDSLLKPFRFASVEGSAVIITTRIKSIARMVETMPFCHLGCLSVDICWLIFKQIAFSSRDPTDHMDLVRIGEKIVKKCKGLPLAVKVLASVLSNEFNHNKWEDMLGSELWDVQDQHNEIIPALRLSYLHLPSYLKPCFLYACVFPKDYEFRKEQLIHLWMAQGLVQCEGHKQVEDIGNMYFDDLMQRSLFSRCPRLPAEAEYFVMHDLIHDLARHISEGVISSCTGSREDDDEKLFPVEGRKVDYLCLERVRHLSISHQKITGTEGMLQYLSYDEPQAIRSLLVLSPTWHYDKEFKLPSEMMLNLDSLRVLHLSSLPISELPDSMGYLRHLRYLNLGGTVIRGLPETIGMLYNLQVLDLEGCWNMKSLPEGVGALCNLRYLNLNKCMNIWSLPEGIGGLHNLQDLTLSSCQSLASLPESMGGLCNLQYLNSNFCQSLVSLPESIGGLRNLLYLNLNFCRNLVSLPESIGGLRNLRCLEIKDNDPSYPRGMSRLTNLRSLVGFAVARRRRGRGEGHGIELLKDMVHLRGRLMIDGLANVVNPEDAVMANLRNKEHIRELWLDWSDSNGDNDDRVLEHLRPPSGLEELRIYGYKGVRFPSWMVDDASSFSRLTRVELSNCTLCTLLPRLGQLPLLKCLEILGAHNVERVGLEFRGIGFPALEVLHFGDMPSWVTWGAAERGDFPRLQELHVSDCPKLESMVPVYLFPALQELRIECCSLLHLIELKSCPSLSSLGSSFLSSSSSSSSYSSSIGPPPLMKMSIWKCPLARFSPEDDPLLLPVTVRDFNISNGCPLLLEWCRRDDSRRRLAHIPCVRLSERETEKRSWVVDDAL